MEQINDRCVTFRVRKKHTHTQHNTHEGRMSRTNDTSYGKGGVRTGLLLCGTNNRSEGKGGGQLKRWINFVEKKRNGFEPPSTKHNYAFFFRSFCKNHFARVRLKTTTKRKIQPLTQPFFFKRRLLRWPYIQNADIIRVLSR